MRFLRERAERSVTQANCNPLLYMVALAAIIGGVAFHFRDAILNVIKDTVEILAVGFLVYAAIHISLHIVQYRRRLSHSHKDVEEAPVEADDTTPADPVSEAERLVNEAFHRHGSEPTQEGSRRVG